MTKTFDVQSYDLAIHFLAALELTAEQRDLLASDLAADIQTAIEDWFELQTIIAAAQSGEAG